jgi:hypothetical protein
MENPLFKNYGITAVSFIEKMTDEFSAYPKMFQSFNGVELILEFALKKLNLSISDKDDFWRDLIYEMAVNKLKFPYNAKIETPINLYRIPNLNNPIPKSKGVLEDFKNVVSKDKTQENFTGVYVQNRNVLVGSNKHILAKFNDSTFESLEGKIINLNSYIESKGRDIFEIPYPYPNVDDLIPSDYYFKKKISLYSLYNFAKSTYNTLKINKLNVNACVIDVGEKDIKVQSLLLATLCEFWLAKGKRECILEVGEKEYRPIVLRFDNRLNLGLIMPIASLNYKDNRLDQQELPWDKYGMELAENFKMSIDDIERQFGMGKSSKKVEKKQITKKPKESTSKPIEAPTPVPSSIEDSLLQYIAGYMSSGMIANLVHMNRYEDLDAIRNIAVEILQREGDKEYNLDIAKEILNRAKAEYLQTKKSAEVAKPEPESLKRFSGNIKDTTYIPRRDIKTIVLKNGDVLTNNDIIDGIYRIKPNTKYNVGGAVMLAKSAKEVAPKTFETIDQKVANKVSKKSFWERMMETGNEPNQGA